MQKNSWLLLFITSPIELRCLGCRSQFKERRSHTPDKCEMICGGCGQSFDLSDLETLDALK